MPVIERFARPALVASLVVLLGASAGAEQDGVVALGRDQAIQDQANPDVVYQYDDESIANGYASGSCEGCGTCQGCCGVGGCSTCGGGGPWGPGYGRPYGFAPAEQTHCAPGPCGQMVCLPLPPCPRKETVVGTNHFWQVTGLPQLPWGPHHGFLSTGCYWPIPDCADNPLNWYAMAELMPLRRDNGRTFNFASQGAAPAPIILDSGDRDFEDDFAAGARVVLGRALGDWYRIEGVWTGGYDWSDFKAVRDLGGNIFTPWSNFGALGPIPGVDPVEFAQISFTSQMNSVELNLRRAIAVPPSYVETSFLVGARYMRIEEDFRFLTNDATPGPVTSVNDVQVATDNDLYGVQIGMLAQFRFHQRGWIDFDIKGVFFANDASQQTVYQQVDNFGVETTAVGHANDETTAYLGDLSLTFNYQCSRLITFRIGYNAWFMTGVSLGADNFERDINLLRLGPPNIDHRGRVIYHGPSIGLVGVW